MVTEAILPHYCCSCGVIGAVLCDSCKYDIISEPQMICFGCRQPIGPSAGCSACHLPYERCWSLGERSNALQQLINVSKYESCREGCAIQAHMLHEIVPALPETVIVTAVPTIRRHIRERGYDHAAKIAEQLALLRGLPYRSTLTRLENFVQQGASRADRLRQAAKSYQAVEGLESDKIYLLVDDVVTTGATLEHAAKALREGGARTVWVAATAYQPQ